MLLLIYKHSKEYKILKIIANGIKNNKYKNILGKTFLIFTLFKFILNINKDKIIINRNCNIILKITIVIVKLIIIFIILIKILLIIVKKHITIANNNSNIEERIGSKKSDVKPDLLIEELIVSEELVEEDPLLLLFSVLVTSVSPSLSLLSYQDILVIKVLNMSLSLVT
jgi:hypothetical protein